MFLTGLLFGSGPCLASCGLILISYIGATRKNPYSGIITYILFSSSRILVYVLLSLVVFLSGQFVTERFLSDSSRYIFIFGGVFIILMGIFLIFGSRISFKPLAAIQRVMVGWDKKNAIILGILYGIIPCGPFMALLSYIGLVSKTWIQSSVYSLSFGLGTFFSPLLLLAIISGYIPGLSRLHIPGLSGLSGIIRVVCGAMIIFLGFQILWRAL